MLVFTYVVGELGHEQLFVSRRIIDFSHQPGMVSWHKVREPLCGVVQLGVEAGQTAHVVGGAVWRKADKDSLQCSFSLIPISVVFRNMTGFDRVAHKCARQCRCSSQKALHQ